MSKTPRNIHGRKGGRGLRPWLLIPKVLAVGVWFGSLITVTFLWLTDEHVRAILFSSSVALVGGAATEPWPVLDQARAILVYVTVPALLLAMLLGIALTVSHGRVITRMRWWRVKVVTVAVGIPLAHFFMSQRVGELRESLADGTFTPGQVWPITFGFLATIVWSVAVIILGRHKPRLGQNWAKSFPKHGNPR